MVIVGIVVGVVALSLGRDRGPARLRIAAERAQALITAHCRQGAILQGRVVGVHVTPTEYEFLVYQGELWQPLPQSRVEELSSGLEAWVSLDGRRADGTDDELPQPQILCLPSGELTPFQIHFELADDALELTLSGRANGQLEVLQGGR